MTTAEPHADELKELWEQLVSCPAVTRRESLEQLCPPGHRFRQELLRLLNAEDGTSDELFRPLGCIQVGNDGSEAAIPLRVGPYAIEGVIGKGGMGLVFRARQDHPVRRSVALKVLRADIATKSVMARFALERAALSRLHHQNIAQLLDVGTDEAGAPYFAMELVEGTSLCAFAEDRRLTIADRIDLVLGVCAGVEHAHARGLIHRDLKPSNILVVLQDGAAVPKIIDFGIARVLASGEEIAESRQTIAGQVFGTPEYMAPEQLDPDAHDVDIRSDVYSLGVILYELSVGALPFDLDQYRSGGVQRLQRLLCEGPMPSPNARNAPGRDGTKGPGRPRIARDLECIILKACAPDRARRYQTVRDLSADLARYRKGEPISARRPSVLYRAGKFVMRHKMATAAAVIVGCGAIASVAMIVQARSNERAAMIVASKERDAALAAEQLAEEQRDAALQSRSEAEAFAGYMRDVVWQARPMNMGHDTPMLAVLQRSADEFLGKLPESGVVKARVAQSLAEPLFWAGDLARTKLLLRTGLEALSKPGMESNPVSRQHGNWFRMMLSQVLSQLGEIGEASQLADEALALARERGQPRGLINALKLAGLLRAMRGDFDSSLVARREALELIKAQNEPPSRLFEGTRDLVHTYVAMGDYVTALELGLPAVDRYADTAPRGEAILMDMQLHLGEALIRVGRLEEARAMLRTVQQRAEAELAAGHHTGFRAKVRLLLADGRLGQAQADIAASELATAIDTITGDDHPLRTYATSSRYFLVELLELAGKREAARIQADALIATAGREGAPQQVEALALTAEAYLAAGNLGDAEVAFQAAFTATTRASDTQLSASSVWIARRAHRRYLLAGEQGLADEWATRK